MSSFLDKFKKPSDVPPGVNLEYSSFGQPQNTYQPPVIAGPTKQQQSRPKGKPGGGWSDDPEPQTQVQTTKPTNTLNLISDSPKKDEQKTQEVILPPQNYDNHIAISRYGKYSQGQLLTYEELEVGGFEHEFHIVNECTKLGGMRLKQSDQVLKDFGIASQNIQEQIIGSIILNKLHSEDNWKIQARCIYAAIYLIQQFKNYRDFFKTNQQYLRVETEEKMLLTAIESVYSELSGVQHQKQEDSKIEYIEPPKPVQQQVQQQKPAPQNIDLFNLTPQQTTQPISTQPKVNAIGFMKNSKPQQQQVPVNELNLLDVNLPGPTQPIQQFQQPPIQQFQQPPIQQFQQPVQQYQQPQYQQQYQQPQIGQPVIQQQVQNNQYQQQYGQQYIQVGQQIPNYQQQYQVPQYQQQVQVGQPVQPVQQQEQKGFKFIKKQQQPAQQSAQQQIPTSQLLADIDFTTPINLIPINGQQNGQQKVQQQQKQQQQPQKKLDDFDFLNL
ncbi:hypothetical protein pb186bvf_015072 [Paramecium bursaria]